MKTLVGTSQTRCGRMVLGLLVLLMLLAGPKEAFATASCSGGGHTYTINLPASVSVPRDAAAGTPLTAWISSVQVNNVYTCVVTNNTATTMGFRPMGSVLPSGATYSTDGVTYTVFESGAPGVGIVIAVRSYANGCGLQYWQDLGAINSAGWVGVACNAGGVITNGGQIRVMLVTTGTVSPGMTMSGTVVEGASIDRNSGSYRQSSGTASTYYAITSTMVSMLACTTPDVLVPMGTHPASEMGSPGSTTAAVSFAISLNSCPAGMGAIQYRIDPVTSVVSSAQSVVALDSSSTASGVAVQLLNAAGTAPFPLSTNQTLTGYSPGSGGSYTIPLKARYYRTGSVVSPGAANTSMQFTMLYQ